MSKKRSYPMPTMRQHSTETKTIMKYITKGPYKVMYAMVEYLSNFEAFLIDFAAAGRRQLHLFFVDFHGRHFQREQPGRLADDNSLFTRRLSLRIFIFVAHQRPLLHVRIPVEPRPETPRTLALNSRFVFCPRRFCLKNEANKSNRTEAAGDEAETRQCCHRAAFIIFAA